MPVDQALDIRSDGANRWQTNQKRKQPSKWQQDVQNQAGVEGWWVQVGRGKNPRQGESLDKDKTGSTTTNKQDPQDTPAGRRITLYPS